MTFRLYDAPAAGTLLWASGATMVAVSTGVFRAVLTPAGLNWESALWLEVEVAGTVLSPREELTAAPFAADALYHSGKKYTNAGAAPASPGAGDLWFDTGTGALKFWSGAAWTSTAGSGAAHAATHAGAGGDPIISLGAHALTGNITMSPGSSLAAGAGSLGVSVSTHLVVGGSINPASSLAVGGPGYSVAFASAVTAGWFYGNGAGLTNISAASPGNMTTTDTAQTITGVKTFSATGGLSVSYGVAAGSATLTAGLTASSGTFTASGPGQYSLSLSSGINAPAGTIVAGQFVGNGAQLTNISAAPPANMATTDTAQSISGVKTFVSTLTVTGNAFSVGGSSFVVVGGSVGVNAGLTPSFMFQAGTANQLNVDSANGVGLGTIPAAGNSLTIGGAGNVGLGGSGTYNFNGTGNVKFTNSGVGGVIVQGMKFIQSGGVTTVSDTAGTVMFTIK